MSRKKKSRLAKRIREAAERLEWNVHEYDDGTVEFQQHSPAGEDFLFTVNAKNAEQEIYDYYDDFDIDEHIDMWIEAKRNGFSGVPTVRELVKDAEDIKEMLKAFAEAVDSRKTIKQLLQEEGYIE